MVVRVCCHFAKIEAFLHGSAVVQPIGDHAAHIGRAAVEHTAAVDYLADRPPVIAAVLLLANDTAHMDNNTAAALVNVFIVCIILVIHARKPAHGGTVYHSVQHAFVCDVGFVLADNTADGGCRCRIVRIDKPLAGGRSINCTAERVKACQTAQITVGTDGLALVATAQGDKQIIGGKTALAVDLPIALCRHSVNALEARVGLACG